MDPAPPVTRTFTRGGLPVGGWQGNLEAAASLDIAYGDLAIVGLNDPADNRKPEARPTVVAAARVGAPPPGVDLNSPHSSTWA
jgi:hypothetical protein